MFIDRIHQTFSIIKFPNIVCKKTRCCFEQTASQNFLTWNSQICLRTYLSWTIWFFPLFDSLFAINSLLCTYAHPKY